MEPGIQMLEEKGGIPVCGVVPYMKVQLEDEDSLTGKFKHRKEALIDLAVIRYPRISNFTDFDVFEHMEGVSVRYVTSVQEIHHPDVIILPGSKNTMGDLKWMRENGMEAMIKKLSADTPVIGICGGYQMLGESLEDPHSVEEGGSLRGMELLPLKTVMSREGTPSGNGNHRPSHRYVSFPFRQRIQRLRDSYGTYRRNTEARADTGTKADTGSSPSSCACTGEIQYTGCSRCAEGKCLRNVCPWYF